MDRRRTCGSSGKKLFLCLLLSWLSISCAFNEKRRGHLKTLRDVLEKPVKNMKTYALMLAEHSCKEEVLREMKMNRVLSSLLKKAGAITDKNKLEIFKNDLQAVVDGAERERLYGRQKSLVDANDGLEHIMEIYKMIKIRIPMMKQASFLKLDVICCNEHLDFHISEFKYELQESLDVCVLEFEHRVREYLDFYFYDFEYTLQKYVSEFYYELQEYLEFYVSEFEDELEEDPDFYINFFELKLQEYLDFYMSEFKDDLQKNLDFEVSESKNELHEEL
ncbi:hypothetical protein OJAV_G00183250 [Oryzias javanicus]|uniref:Uncharacterized protein n=1 Tax=Oryzias javanicus TaxID=123683 RepID=A0A437CEE2_ORYJA|nr:hypothetical protein OJAV_G00183250 [Oryzias javanicus]